jgi:hypothetical protein
MRYELGFYIPEDDFLHTHHCENLKSFLIHIHALRTGEVHDVKTVNTTQFLVQVLFITFITGEKCQFSTQLKLWSGFKPAETTLSNWLGAVRVSTMHRRWRGHVRNWSQLVNVACLSYATQRDAWTNKLSTAASLWLSLSHTVYARIKFCSQLVTSTALGNRCYWTLSFINFFLTMTL